MARKGHERIGLDFKGELPISSFISYAKKAELSGFESIWVADHVGEGRDALSVVCAVVAATSRVRVGTGVLNPYSRHPATIAITMASLDEYSDGRMILGVGAGNPTRLTKKMGIDHVKPALAVRECVEIVNKFLNEQTFTYSGRMFKLSQIGLSFNPVRKHIPIYLGAVKERMLRLAAQIGDGVLFSNTTSPEIIEKGLKVIREEAEKIGRNPNDIDSGCLISCAADKDPEAARQRVRPAIVSMLSRPERGEYLLGETGLDTSILEPLRKALAEGRHEKAYSYVDDRILGHFGIAGTPRQCHEALGRFRASGLRLPILGPVGGTYAAAIEAMAPLRK